MLDELEQRGYIERVRNPQDGRSWIVRLTREGRRLCGKLQQRHRLVMDTFRDALSGAEMSELTRLLEKNNHSDARLCRCGRTAEKTSCAT